MDNVYKHLVCPACGRFINDEGTVFLVQGRFYCDELCGRRAKYRTYEQQTYEQVRQANQEIREGLSE